MIQWLTTCVAKPLVSLRERFASFSLLLGRLRLETKRRKAFCSRSDAQRRVSKEGPESAQGLRSRGYRWSVLRGRFAAPQNEVLGTRPKGEKLCNRAAKPLKSFTRVNLCAASANDVRRAEGLASASREPRAPAQPAQPRAREIGRAAAAPDSRRVPWSSSRARRRV